jgi:hypothetical protein
MRLSLSFLQSSRQTNFLKVRGAECIGVITYSLLRDRIVVK